jgi:hypothetical protein
MNGLTLANGELRSILIATAADTGITGDAASAVEKTTGSLEVNSMDSAKNGKSDTGKGRKAKADPLPVSDLLNILQGILRDLQEAGLPVSATQLPVSDGRPPRVAILMDHVIFDAGKFLSAAAVLAPEGIEGNVNGASDAASEKAATKEATP